MPHTDTTSDVSGSSLVIIEASVETAEAAQALGYHTIFVQRPGGLVEELLDDHALLHSVDLGDEDFPRFVDRVLRPLSPTAAVALDEPGRASAGIVNEILGVPSEVAVECARRLRAARRDRLGPGPAVVRNPGEVGL
ncbi:hypothetical protein [Streptomyces sp. NPDC012510]|uniref:hypothetical protein n=1 Tax=Streptomyces sp. NPDC012510 TaxID=3364838 RepID=UPI0036EDB71F